MTRILPLLSAITALSSCQIIYPSSFHGLDELTYGNENYVLQTYGSLICRIVGSEWMHRLTKENTATPRAITLGEMNNGVKITLLPERVRDEVYLKLGVGSKQVKAKAQPNTYLVVDSRGAISHPATLDQLPANCVCWIGMFNANDGIIAWSRHNEGLSIYFLPQDNEEPAHTFRRFGIDTSDMPGAPAKGEELLVEER